MISQEIEQKISTTPIEECVLCSTKGTYTYANLEDKLFKSPGVWNISECNKCELIWLNPRPDPQSTGLIYKEYYTHEGFTNEFLISKVYKNFPINKKIKYAVANAYFSYEVKVPLFWSIAGYILGTFPWFKKKTFLSLAGFAFKKDSTILDIGCGNGDFLLEMRYLGWNVFGTEVDTKAVVAATSIGVSVQEGSLSEVLYPDNFFDAINMNNVIEHLPNPEETLRICYKILKPGGVLSIRTCSNSSLAHKVYKEDYRGLEIPRHFFIFSPLSLKKIGVQEGFKVLHLSTYLNKYIWLSSHALKKNFKDAAYIHENKFISVFLSFISKIVLTVKPYGGDDILIILKK